ncbi:Polysaccharide pyruvyl transferase [Gimesia panareensis]|uniref:Polysaccharide pyruvyl transferase n=1 Tax=Gimesia panareensis TaxID=2527978 RepID=A0A518FIY1_9PLAN|nr:polysaccharide pyruvyl transferase family protein [Gimesia panareensis]QDV16307.1 Polysaccharide pyruvyl transferase [Gimesia panareensis]
MPNTPDLFTRRHWLKQSLTHSLALASASQLPFSLQSAFAADQSPDENAPTLLLRSGWQTVNIGDIGHSPGILKLLEVYAPDFRIILWPNSVDRGVEPMLKKRFPHLTIVKGRLNRDGKLNSPELEEAFEQADFFLHGSGPSVVSRRELAHWSKTTDKPYGIYGVTVSEVTPELHQLLSGAEFIYTRETSSLKNLKEAKVTSPEQDFAPDATFAIDLTDDPKARAFQKQHQLEPGQYLCAVPRLRYTPYHKIHKGIRWSKDKIAQVESVNREYQEIDHAKLRAAIIKWVRTSGQKVVVCPEMTYQTEIIQPLVIDPLPADVKAKVVAHDQYWLPDEAGSLYRDASAVVSMECHSPIIACAHGTPGLYVRQPTDTIKGQMWYDIGLADWTFEIDEVNQQQIAERAIAVYEHYDQSLAKLKSVMESIGARQKRTMQVVRQAVLKAHSS